MTNRYEILKALLDEHEALSGVRLNEWDVGTPLIHAHADAQKLIEEYGE